MSHSLLFKAGKAKAKAFLDTQSYLDRGNDYGLSGENPDPNHLIKKANISFSGDILFWRENSNIFFSTYTVSSSKIKLFKISMAYARKFKYSEKLCLSGF